VNGEFNEDYDKQTLSGLAAFSAAIEARISANWAAEFSLVSLTVSSRLCAYSTHISSYNGLRRELTDNYATLGREAPKD